MSKPGLLAIPIAILVGAVAANVVGETLWIPAAASNPGLHGTVWTTDLWLHSRVGDAAITVTATFFPEAGSPTPQEATIELPPHAPVQISDAVAVLFGEHRPGAIRISSDYPFWAQSRTVNSGGATGTYGQGIPAFTVDDTAPGFTLLGAANRPGPDGVRTNIGIVNTSSSTGAVNVLARDPGTLELIGISSVEIGPFEWYQSDLFSLLGLGNESIDLAAVSVFPSAFDLVYLSRIDNRSGDATFVYGSSGDSISIVGNPDRMFEIKTTLTYDDGVTVDWMRWPGAADAINYANNPASGYETDIVVRQAPVEYCVLVAGRSGPTPSGVTVSIAIRPPGGEWSGGSLSYSTAGSSQIDKEFCKQIQ